jgi:ring-1,2-phenylacetyl-CoA epoxidase subunit PaaD
MDIQLSQRASELRQLLEQIPDPEIPVLTISDLGILREVHIDDNRIEVVITPTYSGCPAMDMISMQIRLALVSAGYENVTIRSVLSPAWTTEWMSAEGREKLQRYGIAPPIVKQDMLPEEGIVCPQCGSRQTRLVSAFASTACKALYQCHDCKEPFDYFKCH